MQTTLNMYKLRRKYQLKANSLSKFHLISSSFANSERKVFRGARNAIL